MEIPRDYDQLKRLNVLTDVRGLIDRGLLAVNDDGKLYFTKAGTSTNGPWIHVVRDYSKQCLEGMSILFNIYKVLPSMCTKCWKVVVRPRTLDELFALEDIQKELGRPAKCGIEVRNTVHGLYGGYFYNNSLKEGIECYNAVRKAVDDGISPDVKVLLKRGCTEMEAAAGDSSQWEIDPDQYNLESLVLGSFTLPVDKTEQPFMVKVDVYQRWIEWAYKNGDSTYLNYTDGKPLYPDYVTYHDKPYDKRFDE